jgi:hypothetical protein
VITSINGTEAPWTPEIEARWAQAMADRSAAEVVRANYFMPRPYVDAYNTGSTSHGFTYVIGREVFQILLAPSR